MFRLILILIDMLIRPPRHSRRRT